MSDGGWPESSNFFSSLETELSSSQIADLYVELGWEVRRLSWTDFEVRGPWCELAIEGASPVRMQGLVADPVAHAEELVAPLRDAFVRFTAEFYGPPPECPLLRKLTNGGGSSR